MNLIFILFSLSQILLVSRKIGLNRKVCTDVSLYPLFFLDGNMQGSLRMGRGDEDYGKIIIEGRRGYKCKFWELLMTTKKAPSVELVNEDMYKATTERLRNQSSTALKRKREASAFKIM